MLFYDLRKLIFVELFIAGTMIIIANGRYGFVDVKVHNFTTDEMWANDLYGTTMELVLMFTNPDAYHIRRQYMYGENQTHYDRHKWYRLNTRFYGTLSSSFNVSCAFLNSINRNLKLRLTRMVYNWVHNTQTFVFYKQFCGVTYTLRKVCPRYYYGRMHCEIFCRTYGIRTKRCGDDGYWCVKGWRGLNCTVDINECDENTHSCQNGATCHNTIGSYKCTCTPGFQGSRCTEDVNECLRSDWCKNGGTCTNNHGSYRCSCRTGFQKPRCSDINECLRPDWCKNRGTCTNTLGSFKCSCRTGYQGSTCSDDVNECLRSDACENGGTCINTFSSFGCKCTSGYQGSTCSTDVDECSLADLCKNGGTCTNTQGSFRCSCASGYQGTTCSYDVNECLRVYLCKNGGTCVNAYGSFSCSCLPGYSGSDCAHEIDECLLADSCKNGGTCVNTQGSFRCLCPQKYGGPICADYIDACAATEEPCKNEGICINSNGSYYCNCTKNFYGTWCEFQTPASLKAASDMKGIVTMLATTFAAAAFAATILGFFIYRRRNRKTNLV